MSLYKTGAATSEGSKRATTDPIADKSVRSQIHQEVRRIFNSSLETTTDAATGAIVATLQSKRSRNRGRRAPRPECPGQGDYLHFTLFKENRDTLEAVNLISRMLGLKARSVHFAGTKDRRAATVQRCSVKVKGGPRELAKLNPRLYGVKTGDYELRTEPIRLGQLRGNEFTIVVRDCRLPGDEGLGVEESVKRLREGLEGTLESIYAQGWINYFGHQRFGSFATGTNKIGMLILSGRLEEAVNSILEYDPSVLEDPPSADLPRSSPRHDEYNRALACRLLREGEADKAAKTLPKRFAAESALIAHLGRPGSGRDFAGALLRLPRGLRTLYMHAYQSFVWNHAASRRWELYGPRVVAGDLVADAKPSAASQEVGEEEEEDADEAIVSARALSEEEAASGRYSVSDVVLPTAGTDTILPANEVGAFYREFMLRPENGALDPLNLPRHHKEFSVAGRYRPLISRFLAKPSVDVRRYSADDEQMWPTDLDLLEREARQQKGEVGEKRSAEEAEEGPAKKAKVEGGEGPAAGSSAVGGGEGDKVAAILHFQLGRSAYATVAIREMGLAPEGEGQEPEAEQAPEDAS